MSGYIVQVFPIKCLGRDAEGHECLEEAVDVEIFKKFDDTISSQVKCSYKKLNEKCAASTNGMVKGGTAYPFCPYSFDIPRSLEIRSQSCIMGYRLPNI
ncbi:MAG: hypothetical protein AABW56_00110 [Nanoarchaeota archaeon]